jgi:hypothetical protein
MPQEFARNETWREWNSNKYEGWEEYLYVAEGRACIDAPGQGKHSTGKARRDVGHEGWTLDRFVKEANTRLLKDGRKRSVWKPALLTKKEVGTR